MASQAQSARQHSQQRRAAADLMIKRQVISLLRTVRLYPHPRGKKQFDCETVKVVPKS